MAWFRMSLCRGNLFSTSFTRCGTHQSGISVANQMKLFNEQKQFRKALELYDTFKAKSSERVTAMMFIQALKACTQTRDLQRGMQIHRVIPSRVKNDPYIVTSLIHLYMRCGQVASAESLFEEYPAKDAPMHNTMMKGYMSQKMYERVLDVFRRLKNPDEVTIVLLLNTCALLQSKEALNVIREVLPTFPKSFYSNRNRLTSLIDVLMKCGDVKTAESVFLRRTTDDLSLYAAAMSGYVKNQMPFEAIGLFNQLVAKGILDENDHRRKDDAMVESQRVVYLSVINALAEYADLTTSESIVQQIPASYLAHPHVRKALTHMWGKVGSVDKAEQLFSSMSQPDLVRYTAMINTYGLNGMGKQAVQLFDRMPKECVDEKTRICVLNACSHSGLIDEARRIFINTSQPTLKICAVMVDCLSRAALFDEAREVIERYEETSPPSLPMYMALLSGCRNHRRGDLAEEVHNRMVKHFPRAGQSMTAAAVLFANAAASSGDMDTASDARIRLERSEMKKIVGLSWTTVNGQFYVSQKSASNREEKHAEIHAEAKRMMAEAEQLGHRYNACWVTRPLQPGETNSSILGGHSEKLAIAWNFVENPQTKRIQVAKNLRVCGDCHAATKLIALARQRDIIVRDANRMHHFGQDGNCSCSDYF